MALELNSLLVFTTLLLVVTTLVIYRLSKALIPRATASVNRANSTSTHSTPSILSKTLASELPHCVILPDDAITFEDSMKSYWAQQECEVMPACVVRPRNVQDLATAITILKREFSTREAHSGGIFAIRSGGHSPIPGAASIGGGVLIDLCHFREVIPSKDGSSVVIGTGAKWKDVSETLDERGLAVVGGRNSAVGVGGLTLGGGLSFFSPRFGLVCSNVISYEVVLASGSVVTASASTNSDLWRALKGGANNFGIVTRFTVRSFPSTKIWSGFLYIPAFQAAKVLSAFHDCVDRARPGSTTTLHDSHAAGPLVSFSYIYPIRTELISANLVYTKLPEKTNQWPIFWKTSSFPSFWRFWSTCKVRTLTNATDELNALNPPGRRQTFGTTTIKNDPATLTAMHAAYHDAITSLRRAKVKGLVWTLVLQPLLPAWVRKGDPNPQGLHDGTDEPLVIVSFTINWDGRQNDEFIKATARHALEQMEAFAVAHGTSHPWRYLNYCAEWQRPFEGYGEENLRFLRGVSRRYDPEALFQRGCVGGFKLG